jgi:hypothetical protein
MDLGLSVTDSGLEGTRSGLVVAYPDLRAAHFRFGAAHATPAEAERDVEA